LATRLLADAVFVDDHHRKDFSIVYDLLLKNGTLVDPTTTTNQVRDLAVTGSLIAAVLDADSRAEARRTLDVSGLYVMPGFIDLHVHVFSGVTHYGIDVDPTCLGRGVTTALDAGSAGSLTFPGFRQFVIDVSQTRLFALLNISALGLVPNAISGVEMGELEDLRYVDVKEATRVIEANRDKILGVKLRLSDNLAAGGENEMPALLRAREVADAVGLPLMVHTPLSSLSMQQVLKELRPGDVLTHSFHGHRCGILDSDMKVLPEVRKKVDEGLLLDTGHGEGSFTFEVARAALSQGVLPHIISSDLHAYNLNGPVFDLVTTINKFLHLGVDLDATIRRVTTIPAEFLKMETEIGTLQSGAVADIVVAEMLEGSFEFTDTFGNTETGGNQLEPRYIFRAGRQVGVVPKPEPTDRGRSSTLAEVTE
jgi:dihydroorotase